MNMLDNVMLGLQTALQPHNLLFCFFGVILGNIVGVLPGIGALAAMSLLFPITFHMDATSALIMLAGIYYGTAYGGSITSILLNVPGGASSAVTCLDGYPMARNGRAGVALFVTTIASFVAGSTGILLMMLFSPPIVAIALSFGAAEYFSLMVLGLITAAAVSSGSVAKGIGMVVLGVLLGTVGLDMYTATSRFSFGILELNDGISLAALVMGLFGLTEVITSVRTVVPGQVTSVALRSMIPTRQEARDSIAPTVRGTLVGSMLGMLPAGGISSPFIAYALERRLAKDPSRFGKGAIEGVVAPEAANNAADQMSFVPMMTLGIPSGVTMALMLGILMINGIRPGPTLMIEHPDIFWGLVMSFWIGNVLLVILNIPLISVWVRLLQIPYHFLYPTILAFIAIGAYSVSNSSLDVIVVVLFGVAGYAFRLLDLPPAPLILGFVLGPILEDNMRRSLIISRGDFMVFIDRPISAVILSTTLAILAWTLLGAFRRRHAERAAVAKS